MNDLLIDRNDILVVEPQSVGVVRWEGIIFLSRFPDTLQDDNGSLAGESDQTQTAAFRKQSE